MKKGNASCITPVRCLLNEEQDFLPVEQQTLMFYGKPIVVVRLPDGRPGVVLRFLWGERAHDRTLYVPASGNWHPPPVGARRLEACSSARGSDYDTTPGSVCDREIANRQ